MTSDRPHGQPVPGWIPPPWPGPMRLEGRWLRLDPLTVAHAAALDAANRADDAIWDYLPYGPFADEAGYAAWVTQAAGKAEPLFFAVTNLAAGTPAGVMSLMRITPAGVPAARSVTAKNSGSALPAACVTQAA